MVSSNRTPPHGIEHGSARVHLLYPKGAGEYVGTCCHILARRFLLREGEPLFGLAPLLGKVPLLPLIALNLGHLMGLSQLEVLVTTLMSAMPVAVALVVFSDVYDFHREEIYSLVLITSLLSPIYLGAWLIITGWK